MSSSRPVVPSSCSLKARSHVSAHRRHGALDLGMGVVEMRRETDARAIGPLARSADDAVFFEESLEELLDIEISRSKRDDGRAARRVGVSPELDPADLPELLEEGAAQLAAPVLDILAADLYLEIYGGAE